MAAVMENMERVMVVIHTVPTAMDMAMTHTALKIILTKRIMAPITMENQKRMGIKSMDMITKMVKVTKKMHISVNPNLLETFL
jgi:type III secretory pathway component EscR